MPNNAISYCSRLVRLGNRKAGIDILLRKILIENETKWYRFSTFDIRWNIFEDRSTLHRLNTVENINYRPVKLIDDARWLDRRKLFQISHSISSFVKCIIFYWRPCHADRADRLQIQFSRICRHFRVVKSHPRIAPSLYRRAPALVNVARAHFPTPTSSYFIKK